MTADIFRDYHEFADHALKTPSAGVLPQPRFSLSAFQRECNICHEKTPLRTAAIAFKPRSLPASRRV